jgi:hypothetical protein
MTYFFEEAGWKKAYQENENRKKIWIYIKFSDASTLFLSEYSDWLTIEKYCNDKNKKIKLLGLQYRTNRIVEKVQGEEGVYLVRSLKAGFGEKPRQCYTIGIVRGDKIEKKTWAVPELSFEFASVDLVETSFEKAIVRNETETKTIQ